MSAAALPMILMAGGSLMSAFGQIREGEQAEDAGKYNANQTRAAADVKAGQIREDAKRVMASQRARYGASGVDMEGSPLLVLAESARNAKLDELMVKYGAENQARMMEWEGKQKKKASYWGAGQSILTGASGTMNQYSRQQAGNKYLEMQRKGGSSYSMYD